MAANGVLRTLQGGQVGFHCPGCDTMHVVTIEAGHGPVPWGFNGDYDRPTFTPSVLVRGTVPMTGAQYDAAMKGEQHTPIPFICHSYVTDGRIQFLDDCSHDLKGQTVSLSAEPVTSAQAEQSREVAAAALRTIYQPGQDVPAEIIEATERANRRLHGPTAEES